MGFTIERLALDDPLTFNEQIGDPVADFGGTPVPAPRMALRHSVSIATFPAPGTLLTAVSGQLVRRQMRSLLNNTQYKLAAYYVNWTADPEQNGWYVPDMGQLADGSGSSGLATGWWNLENVVWRKVGARRTHRRALSVTLLTYLTGVNPRDYQRRQYSTDFYALTPLALTYLAPAAVDIVYSATGAVVSPVTLTAGSDGASPILTPGLSNLSVVSFEQPEASQTLGGVLCYDRNGNTATAPNSTWTEVYGPDWPWHWPNTSSAVPDTPVLSNESVQVRWDTTFTPGFIISVWNQALATPLWQDQCKVWFQRYNSGLATPLAVADMTLQSAGIEEYTPERCVLKVVLTAAGDASSREIVYVTLQRGWSGPRFELYPAPTATATPLAAAGWICFTPVAADTDDSFFAVFGSPTNGAVNVATALGTGHTGLFTTTDVGGTASLSDNGMAMLRSGAVSSNGSATAYQMNLAVIQAAANIVAAPTVNAYGSSRNTVIVQGPQEAEYCSVHTSFFPTQPLQSIEAELMSLGSGTSSTSDATASNALAASATRTSDNLHVTKASWPNGSGNSYAGVYRVFARCRTTAGTMSVYASTSAGNGATVTTTSTTYVWLDLGDITLSPAGTSLALSIHAWTSSGTLYVDRIEAYIRQDRTSTAPQYEGVQDLGQAALYNSYALNGIVSRS